MDKHGVLSQEVPKAVKCTEKVQWCLPGAGHGRGWGLWKELAGQDDG